MSDYTYLNKRDSLSETLKVFDGLIFLKFSFYSSFFRCLKMTEMISYDMKFPNESSCLENIS